MSANRHPQPLPPEIYRRRRIALLVIIGLLVWAGFGISNLVSGGSRTTNPSASASAGGITTCDPKNLEVQAFIGDGKAPKSAFAAGENPQIWWNITNLGTTACTFNVGSKVQFYTITSGNETIWSSADCDRSQDIDYPMTLQPGAQQQSSASGWDRVYSSSSGCGAEQNPVPGGGASYHLSVKINGVESAQDVQFLLN